MKYLIHLLPSFTLLLIISCSSRIESKKKFNNLKITYIDTLGTVLSKGLKNKQNKEVGYWEYYDSTGNVIEKGEYKKGLLFNKWVYYLKDFKGTINWKIESDKNLVYNYPSDFNVNKRNTDNIIIYNNDSSYSISIIAIDSILNIDEYKLHILNNVKKDCISLKGECHYLEYKNTKSYFLHFYQEKVNRFNVINTYIINFNKKIYEIKMECKVYDNFPYQYYMTIFISIVAHLYIDNLRVIDPNSVNVMECNI